MTAAALDSGSSAGDIDKLQPFPLGVLISSGESSFGHAVGAAAMQGRGTGALGSSSDRLWLQQLQQHVVRSSMRGTQARVPVLSAPQQRRLGAATTQLHSSWWGGSCRCWPWTGSLGHAM